MVGELKSTAFLRHLHGSGLHRVHRLRRLMMTVECFMVISWILTASRSGSAAAAVT